MTLWDFMTIWLDTYVRSRRAPATAQAYTYALAHLSEDLRYTELQDVQAIMLQRDLNALAAQYSRQAQILFVALRAGLHRAQLLGYISQSPMVFCEPPAHRKRPIEYLDAAEAAAYLRAARSCRAYTLLSLMLIGGLRRNEALGLIGSDVDIVRGCIHVSHQRKGQDRVALKTASSIRDIPLPIALLSAINRSDGFLCDCSATELRRQHMRALRLAGIDRHVTLHGLRHTCATLAIRSGAQLTSVQSLLGHAKFSTTADCYVHTDTSALAAITCGLFTLAG